MKIGMAHFTVLAEVFFSAVDDYRFFFFSSRRRHTRLQGDWSSDVCSSDLEVDQKYYLTLRHGVAADVRYLITPNPSSLLLLAEKLTAFADNLIHDVRKGTVKIGRASCRERV